MNQEVQRLFEAALAVPEGERQVFVENQTAEAAVRREVLSLVFHDAVAERFFDEAIGSERPRFTPRWILRPAQRSVPIASFPSSDAAAWGRCTSENARIVPLNTA